MSLGVSLFCSMYRRPAGAPVGEARVAEEGGQQLCLPRDIPAQRSKKLTPQSKVFVSQSLKQKVSYHFKNDFVRNKITAQNIPSLLA